MNKITQNNPKFQQIVQTGADLFHRFGTKRISVEEICKTAGVSKVTFYKFFANKRELIKCLFNEIADETEKRFIDIMEKDISFVEKINLTVQLKMDQAAEVSQAFINDIINNSDEEIKQLIRQRTKEGIELATRFYRDAQKKGEMRKDINLDFVIYFLQKLRQLMVDEHLTKLYDSPKELSRELMNLFFYGILPLERGQN